MKIEAYYINCDHHQERAETTEKLLQSLLTPLKIPYERFSAISPSQIDEVLEREKIKVNENKTSGEIGCALSHILLWRKAVQKNLDYMIIFEDDIQTYANSDTLNHWISKLTSIPFDIAYLGRCVDRCDRIEKVDEGIYIPYSPSCTHSYMISRSFMKKMAHSEYYHVAIDECLLWHIKSRELKALAVHPSIFVQDVLTTSSSLRPALHTFGNAMDCKCKEQIYQEDYSNLALFLGIVVITILILSFRS
jgi:GR25 family glycosyltransferase involved in LPS biosynthesis